MAHPVFDDSSPASYQQGQPASIVVPSKVEVLSHGGTKHTGQITPSPRVLRASVREPTAQPPRLPIVAKEAMQSSQQSRAQPTAHSPDRTSGLTGAERKVNHFKKTLSRPPRPTHGSSNYIENPASTRIVEQCNTLS